MAEHHVELQILANDPRCPNYPHCNCMVWIQDAYGKGDTITDAVVAAIQNIKERLDKPDDEFLEYGYYLRIK